MSQITLDVVSMDSAPLPEAHSCRFEGEGGTIGRDESNTFVLQDKHRRVSRLHAAVTFPQGVPTITNASTSLPVCVGDVPLDCGRTMPLKTGDVLEIGPYILKVRSAAGPVLDAPAAVAAPVAAAGPISQQVMPPRASPPAAASIPSEVDNDPFASLLSGMDSRAPSVPAVVGPRVELSGASVGSPNPDAIAAALKPLSGQALDDPLAGLFDASGQAGGQRVNEVSAVSSDPLAAMGFGPEPGAGSYGSGTPRAKAAPASIIPEDFNPFDLPSETGRNSADPLSSMLGGSAAAATLAGSRDEPSIDLLFTSSGPSNFDEILTDPRAGSSSQQGLDALLATPGNSDPLAMFGDQSPADEVLMRPMRDDLAEIGGAFQAPRAVDFNRPAVPQADRFSAIDVALSSPAPGPASAPDLLLQAFLRGANLPPSALPNGLTPEIMALIGSVLRSATAGAVDMLAARTATKLEVQASVTIISSQGNNPLKFLPNGDAALLQLLSKKMPGFMRADEAMKDAFDDLRAHEVGVIAGTRAALAEVLGKFDPAILGERLTSGSFLENFLPSVRKTKLWDIYLERYAQIRREAEDDFQSIFGRAFVQAYERETARMKARAAEVGEKR